MQGGGKTIGRHSGGKTELEEYFADLPEDPIERDGDPQPHATDDRQLQEELRRLSAYVSHLKRTIPEFAESSHHALKPALSGPRYATMIAGLASVLIVGVAIGLAARLSDGRD
jgi:hypothetical protein